MLQVDIEVPVMGRTYEFLIDENLTVETVTVRVASAICIKEQCMSSGNEKNCGIKKEEYVCCRKKLYQRWVWQPEAGCCLSELMHFIREICGSSENAYFLN